MKGYKMKTSTRQFRPATVKTAVALVFAALLGSLCITPALADDHDGHDHDHDRDHYDRDWHDRDWHDRHDRHWDRDHRDRYYYPAQVYAPVPVYAPPPVYYAPPEPSGISIFLPIHIH
jgi:ABC-type Zn2+ transport system substrate-binding protein/surface adhesin